MKPLPAFQISPSAPHPTNCMAWAYWTYAAITVGRMKTDTNKRGLHRVQFSSAHQDKRVGTTAGSQIPRSL